MKNLKKIYTLHSTPEFIFKALTNPLTIEIWSGSSAVMEPIAGTEFSLWDGDITGKNLEIIENKKLVQQWYFEGEEYESIVTILLEATSKSTTRLELLHTNIPEEAFENIAEGWDKYYIKPLKLLVED
jgi:activator of HSP90 ATPase